MNKLMNKEYMRLKIDFRRLINLLPVLILISFLNACKNNVTGNVAVDFSDTAADRIKIASMLDSFNIAAGKADFNGYFKYYSDDAVFIGTDPTEYWNLKDFKSFAKPYFDKGKAWNFTSLQRNIYFDKSGLTAWFDELLNTQMKICRGSGVLVKEDNNWKIKQYVLSMTVPNSQSGEVIKVKSAFEDSIIKNLTTPAR